MSLQKAAESQPKIIEKSVKQNQAKVKEAAHGYAVFDNKSAINIEKQNIKKKKGGLNTGVLKILVPVAVFIVLSKIFIGSFVTKDAFFFFSLWCISELLNTAIELISDYIQPKYDPKIKDIKDVAGSATMSTYILYILYLFAFYIFPKIYTKK